MYGTDYTQEDALELHAYLFPASLALDGPTQNLLGQCHAYIIAILGTPIRPDYRRQLLWVALARGAKATTAIEGNTLSDAEVEAIQAGKSLPVSKEYLEKEVKNILVAFNLILNELIRDKSEELISPDLIRRFHRLVGEGLGDAFVAEPGSFRRKNVVVGNYRPPSFEEVPALVDNLCAWLDREFHFRAGQSFEDAMIEAIVAHIYIEWIHPFGDGNGRTGRLLEFYILMRAGVPNVASHLLSNYYNETREDYYRKIEEATATDDLSLFIAYAALGLRDGLKDIFERIQEGLFRIVWENYIHDRVGSLRVKGRNDATIRRLRLLALAMPIEKDAAMGEVANLSAKVAKEYATKSRPTISRDLSVLLELGLIVKSDAGYRANIDTLRSLAPVSTGRIG
jgi:Fic family protein